MHWLALSDRSPGNSQIVEEAAVRFRPSATDFYVEEALRLPLKRSGPYTIYRIQKHGITTLQAQERLAAALGLPGSSVAFPALKDREASSVQFGTLRGDGPESVVGKGFHAQRVGSAARPIVAQDLVGNRFVAVLRGMSASDVVSVSRRLECIEASGFPNYFDQQRFGSYIPGEDWIGKLILKRDAEGALRAHLAGAFVGDPPHVRRFKQEARRHWGEWQHLLQVAPRPSNLRSVLTFLVDHPLEYRKALNLVTPRVMSLYLAAYQSLLWNRLAGRYLETMLNAQTGWPAQVLTVAGEHLPLYAWLTPSLLTQLGGVALPVFERRMAPTDAIMLGLCEQILAEEGLRPEDLKARLLTRAYLGKGARPLLVFPSQVQCGEAAADETTPGKQKVTVSFVLRPGSYATLMLKALVGSTESVAKELAGGAGTSNPGGGQG